MNTIERGSAVVARGSRVVGLVLHTDRSEGLAWVAWPNDCGLSECIALNNLNVICDRETVTNAIQAIAPARQLSNPLERAFLGASQASTQIVEYDDADDGQQRPYYAGRNRR